MSWPLHLGAALYPLAVRAAAPFVPKARRWVADRQGLWERLEANSSALKGCIWMHCASVGEFEQGRPVLEALKAARPELPVLLTFFSPSGLDAWKDHPGATHVDVLPADSAANAHQFLRTVQPSAVLWVRYEFWPHHLNALAEAKLPTYLIAGIFRPQQPFFRWFGAGWRKMLAAFTHMFVQDEGSRALLAGIGVRNVSVSGDNRFDRVAEIARANTSIPTAEAFRGNGPLLIAGSSWPAEEDLLIGAYRILGRHPRTMVVPHELHADHLRTIEERFPKPLARWSEVCDSPVESVRMVLGEERGATLLVDRMGLLSRLYRYGDVALVGGGFGDGIHSLLESVAWGTPVIFGPNHHKFAEGRALIEAGAGFEVNNAEELAKVLERLLYNEQALQEASRRARQFVEDRTGATLAVVQHLSKDLGF